MEKKAKISRTTSETDIAVELIINSVKDSDINSGIPFFDHMLQTMSRHGRIYLKLLCKGDNEIDDHHSVEDIGIAVGQALKNALGDKSGIPRFGDCILPMEDTLTLVAVDLSGRPFFKFSGKKLHGYIGKYSEELTFEFLRSFSMSAGINLHVKVFYGNNKHHIHESIFKALGLSIYKASSGDKLLNGTVLTTKGMLE